MQDDQRYFDKNKAREKICAGWLKEQGKSVRKPVLAAAVAGIGNGLGVIVQSALLAFIVQALIIDKVQWPVLINPLLGLFAVFILRAGCIYRHQTAGFEAGAKVRASIRQQLFDKFAVIGPCGGQATAKRRTGRGYAGAG